MRYIEGIHRKTRVAFSEYVDDFVTEDNPVRIIDAFVESLDMNELGLKKVAQTNIEVMWLLRRLTFVSFGEPLS